MIDFMCFIWNSHKNRKNRFDFEPFYETETIAVWIDIRQCVEEKKRINTNKSAENEIWIKTEHGRKKKNALTKCFPIKRLDRLKFE